MRWFYVLLSAGVVIGSPWIAEGQSASVDFGTLGNPMTDARVTPVTMTAVRPLEIEGTHASPIPEPSAGFAIALLGSAFLIRRRRPRLD